MASITISVDDKAITDALHELQSKVIDLRPVLIDIGEILLNSTEDRFEQGVDPTGKPWVTLQPWYQEDKKKNKGKILLLEGKLYSSLAIKVSDDAVSVGTNVPYAAIHQFGGVIRPKKAKFLAVGGFDSDGKAKGGAKHVTIPARPFLGVNDEDKDFILHAVLDHIAAAWR